LKTKIIKGQLLAMIEIMEVGVVKGLKQSKTNKSKITK